MTSNPTTLPPLKLGEWSWSKENVAAFIDSLRRLKELLIKRHLATIARIDARLAELKENA